MYRLFIIFAAAALFTACSSEPSTTDTNQPTEPTEYLNQVAGEAQGTTYHVSYIDSVQRDLKPQFDSILAQFDRCLSNWNKESTITGFNGSAEMEYTFVDTFFYFNEVYQMSLDVWEMSEGAFDPTVLPLVNAWGFGYGEELEMDQTKVDSMLEYVSFAGDNIYLTADLDLGKHGCRIVRKGPMVNLDFNAIAQGYSVDVICQYLDELGLENYIVEIGGELKAKGQNAEGNDWRVQVDKPVESDATNRERQAVISIPSGRAMATSGNYRKFREENGVKLSHTIDPRTGYPVSHSLLSATVLAENCALADGLATAFMVMGAEKTKVFLETPMGKTVNVYLIFSDENGELQTYSSTGMESIITEAD